MFDLVADVKSYEQFLPWVSAIRVRSDNATEMVADMIVGFKGLRETFTSRVQKTRPSEIHVDYLEGPLKYLTNHWKFAPEPDGCAVDFCVDFAFPNRVFEMLAGQVFDRAQNGPAHVRNPVPNSHLVFRLILEKKQKNSNS